MVSTGHLLSFALASLVLIVIPGPGCCSWQGGRWRTAAARVHRRVRRLGPRDSCITPRAACDLRKLRGKNLILRPANASRSQARNRQ